MCNHSRPDLCDTLSCKTPFIDSSLPRSETIETGLDNVTKARFEFGLADALASTSAVQWTTKQFGIRIYKMIEMIASLNQTSFDETLLAAFAGGSVHTAGFVGFNTTSIKQALLGGNIREVFGLVYLVSGSHWVSSVLLDGLDRQKWSDDTMEQIGLVPAVVHARYELVKATLSLPSEDQYNGFPSFLYSSFDSWVRLDYAGPDENAKPTEWQPIRVPVKPHCKETTVHSNDNVIKPPLSPSELAYQCGNASSCKLQWYPGGLCYNLQDLPFRKQSQVSARVPGFIERFKALGWRKLSGPSGTTATVLQLGRMLGFDPRLLRLVMIAWMVRSFDHSFFEIMIGADPFMPRGWTLNYTMTDFGALMPEGIEIQETGGNQVFERIEVWNAIVRDWLMASPNGVQVLEKMSSTQVTYLLNLLHIG